MILLTFSNDKKGVLCRPEGNPNSLHETHQCSEADIRGIIPKLFVFKALALPFSTNSLTILIAPVSAAKCKAVAPQLAETSGCTPASSKYLEERKTISKIGIDIELVSKELNHFGVIAGLFRQIGGHSSRFGLFCSF